jgi:hypothetical protein
MAKDKEETVLLEAEDVLFTEEDHSYVGTVSGKTYISATTLLKKFGFTPSEYDGIPKEILAAKAAYGTAVHKALEEYILGDETQLIIPEVQAFADWLESQSMTTLDCIAEQKVFNEYYGIAGTIDLQMWNLIADFKTTATLHLVPVMWQLSLYNFLLHPDEEKYVMFEPKVFWFSSAGTLTVRDVPLVPYSRLVNMLEAYKAGDETWVDVSVPEDLIEKVDMIVKQTRLIKTLKKNLKELEGEKDLLKSAIEDQMKDESRIYIDAPAGVITLSEVTTSRYDSKKVTALLSTYGLDKKDYVSTSMYTRVNIKDKGK